MKPSIAGGKCPFCGRIQIQEPERLWRCPGCNLFVREEDLVLPDGGPPEVEAESRDFCPWCAYPVAQEYSLPEEGEFPCPGCAGTLTAGMLETQAAIDTYRKKRLSGGGFLLFAIAILAAVALALWILAR